MMDFEELSQLCFDHACEALRDDRGVASESLLALFAGLTGTQLFVNEAGLENRAWELPPGATVDLEGVKTGADELCDLIGKVVEGYLAKPPRIAARVPEDHRPPTDYPELVADHFDAFGTLLDRQNIEAEERPFLYAVVAAQTLITVEKMLPLPVGLRIVDDGIRRCARTRPLERKRRVFS